MLNELKWKALSRDEGIIWIIHSFIWKIHKCHSIVNAITANGEFSNEGQIKRKPSMFYTSVFSPISTVEEGLAVHTYLKCVLVLCSSAGWARENLLPLSWSRRASISWALGSPWDTSSNAHPCLFHPPFSCFHACHHSLFPPWSSRSKLNHRIIES